MASSSKKGDPALTKMMSAANFSAEELRKVFNAMAKEEKTDALSKANFKALMQGLFMQRGNAVVPDADLDAAFIAADEDNSGSVDLFEFIRLFDLVKSGALIGIGSAPPSAQKASPAKKSTNTANSRRSLVEGDECTWHKADDDLPQGTLGRVLRVHGDGDVEVLFFPEGKPETVFTFSQSALVPTKPRSDTSMAAAPESTPGGAISALGETPAATNSKTSSASAANDTRGMSGNVYIEKRNFWVPSMTSRKAEDVWKLRRCECSDSGELTYRTRSKEVSLSLLGCTVAQPDLETRRLWMKSPPPPTTFLLMVTPPMAAAAKSSNGKDTSGQEWRLACPDQASLEKWEAALSRAANPMSAVTADATPSSSTTEANAASSSSSSSSSSGGAEKAPSRGGSRSRSRSRSKSLSRLLDPLGRSKSFTKRAAAAAADEAATVPQTVDYMSCCPATSIPTRFMDGCGQDEVKALRRWQITHKWRMEHQVDGWLTSPPAGEHVRELKQLYAHFFHRRARNGHVVYYDRMNGANFKKMVALCSYDEIVSYYLYLSEYCYLALEPNDPGGRMCNVYDLQYVGYTDLFGSSIKMAKEVVANCAAHYPERADKVFVINAPAFFSAIWTIVSPLLDPRTRSKVSISSKDRTELLAFIDPANVPLEYGGTDPTPIGQAPEELDMVAYTLKCAELDRLHALNVRQAQEAGLPPPVKPARDPHALLAAVRAARGAAPTESGEIGCGHAHDLCGVALGEKARALAHAQACALVATYGHALKPDLASSTTAGAGASSAGSTTGGGAAEATAAGGTSEGESNSTAPAEQRASQNKNGATAEAPAADSVPAIAPASSNMPPSKRPGSATQRLFKPMEDSNEDVASASTSSSSSSSNASYVFKAFLPVLLSLILVVAWVAQSEHGSANLAAVYGLCVENLPSDLSLMLKASGWLPEGAQAAKL